MYNLLLSVLFAVAPAQDATPEVDLQPNTAYGCDKLAYNEQQFAQNLSEENSMLFCSKFSPAQRQEALSVFQNSKDAGAMISNDDIVDTIASKYGMTSPAPAASDDTSADSSSDSSTEATDEDDQE